MAFTHGLNPSAMNLNLLHGQSLVENQDFSNPYNLVNLLTAIMHKNSINPLLAAQSQIMQLASQLIQSQHVPETVAAPESDHSSELEDDSTLNDSLRLLKGATAFEMHCTSTPSSNSNGDLLDESQADQANRRARFRSVLSDDTVRVLKAEYEINPKPSKREIVELANQVDYPARVIQVWFQNTRARDRRLGRLPPSSMGRLPDSFDDPSGSQQSDSVTPIDLSTRD